MSEQQIDTDQSAKAGAREQALLDFAVSQSSAVFYIADLTGDQPIRFISSNVESITGHGVADFLNDANFGYHRIHKDDLPGYMQNLERLKDCRALTHDYRFAMASGEYRWFRDEIRLAETDDGSLEFVGCMTDIHERVVAEQERQRLDRLLHDAVESLPSGFVIYDAEGRLVLANRGLALVESGTEPKSLIGLKRQEVILHLLSRVQSVDGHAVTPDAKGAQELDERLIDPANPPVEVELKDGTWRLLTCSPTSEGGHVVISANITELKQAETTLREGEEQFRAIVEGNPSPVRVAEADTWKVLYESPAAAALFGRSWPSRLGHSTVDTYGDEAMRQEVIRLLNEDGRIDNHEVLMKRANGEAFWVAMSARFVNYHGKKVCVTSLVDLTESKIRETELRQARETLEDAVEALSEGFVLYDAEDRLVLSNSQYREFNKPFADLFVPGVKWIDVTRARAERGYFKDSKEDVEEFLQRQLSKRGKSFNEEVEIDDGRCFSVYHRRTRQGGIVLTWREITERKQMEQALRESQELIRRVVEDCPLPILMTRASDGRIVFESPASRIAFGVSDERESEWMTDRYVDEDLRGRYLDDLKKAGSVDDYEIEFRRSDGSTFIGAVSARLIEYHDEAVIVSTTVDLTERIKRENELRQARETLDDAIESLSEGLVLYDAQDRLVLCNSQYKEFHSDSADLLVPGARWQDITRARAERGLFRDAEGHIEAWLDGQFALRGKAQNEVFEFPDDRWYEYSHRPTRQGGFVSTWRDITERMRLEQVLRDSEAMVRQVLEACPLPVRMWKPDTGDVVYESPACQVLFGRDATTVSPGERHSAYVDLSDRERYLEQLYQRHAVDDLEMQLRHADGSLFWASVSARLIQFRDEDMVVSAIVDLTERKQRELEIQQAREVLEDAIESLPDGFTLYDADNRFIMCNSRFREYNELSADYLKPGVPWLDFVRAGAERGQYVAAQGLVDEWMEERTRYHSLGTGEPGGLEFQQNDGRWYHAFSQNTRQGGYVGIRIDVTERKRMDLALRQSEERVRRVLEACPVPITMNRANDGIIIYESPAAQRLLKCDEPQEGKSVKGRWAHAEDREAYLRRLRRTGTIDALEVRFKKADGEEFWVALSSRLIEYQGEEVIVSNLFDLTERRSVEAEMTRQREMLHQSEKLSALGELLAGVSHELNNPLSVLVGQALMLQETAKDEQVIKRAEKIGNAANRCARIVKTFLAMARDETSDSKPIDLNEVIEGAIDVTAYSLRAAGIDVSLRLAKELPTVHGDVDQMRQVFTNLIVNAQHALEDVDGPRKIHITSSYRKQRQQVVIKVKDNGPGVPQPIRSRIFEPLFTTKQVGTGTGIGLALCHRIIEAHGGTIWVEGAPTEGAVFVIRLPLSRELAALPPTSRSDLTKPAGFKVLVVDDDFDVGQIISDVLSSDGHSIEVAVSGTQAMAKIESNDYDVILSDIRMPGMDGPSFYRALSRKKPKQIDALAFITGDTLSPRVKEFLDSCERPYLEKPVTPKDIRELVSLLTRRQIN